MKQYITLLAGIFLVLISACSTQSSQPLSNPDSVPINPIETGTTISIDNSLAAPDLFLDKAGKTLKLVRIMEGGACKNELQGAISMFRVYANHDDIKRITEKQGTSVFNNFQTRIERFSMHSLQQTVDQLSFQLDPFAINLDDAKQKIATQLINTFENLIVDELTKFETETTLIIDVKPMSNSLIIFLDECSTPHPH